MTSQPNRSRRPAPGYSPKPREVSQLREEMQLTQTAFGNLLYASLSAVQAWEGGVRRMPGLTWEYVCLLWGFPAVAAARKTWAEDLQHEWKQRG